MAAKKRPARKQGRSTARGKKNVKDYALRDEIIALVLLALMVYLFLCNLGLCGQSGNAVSAVMFGVFGLRAYVMPVAAVLAALFFISNAGRMRAVIKILAGAAVLVLAGIVIDLAHAWFREAETVTAKGLYETGVSMRGGGGVIPGLIGHFLYKHLSLAGTILAVIVLLIIALVILTEKSFLQTVRKGGRIAIDHTGEYAAHMADVMEERARTADERARRKEELRAQRQAEREAREEERRLKEEQKEDEKILRSDRKAYGVTTATDLREGDEDPKEREIPKTIYVPEEESFIDEGEVTDDIHEITVHGFEDEDEDYDDADIKIAESPGSGREAALEEPSGEVPSAGPGTDGDKAKKDAADEDDTEVKPEAPPKEYTFPPLTLLNKGKKGRRDSAAKLKETAKQLEDVLTTFHVNAKVTDISQGPTVTRYELHPEVGVKVSKILSLTDDIKMNLAATDIRIEAPIPGKAAVGIEVPNEENVTVTLRELLESDAYQSSNAKLTFAVGKDISGQTVVTDIAKMPHLLIAGSTGAGKSVCINTIILSIIYKARPDEVRLVMVDPKVVELSVYNGIPHLMIPVVTDPKKAAAALNWAVEEMTKRYKKFADAQVRDLAGYNQWAAMQQGDKEDPHEIMPQIVVIVDELADLMMVSKNEVEGAICRLAQLARAAGIHLIIATQRPSVDVITGLIKANMPSRIAFAVSSGIDSRTILDMNGAERLLGKGDMLFFPQNYSKPVRIQGAFVSDDEIVKVTEFLKKEAPEEADAYEAQVMEEIEKKMEGGASPELPGAAAGSGNGRDEYFVEAGRFIIEKEKASIGNLQRVFKIGFNRAARIMDQLCEAGVVGEEEGTKPRRILMSQAEFEAMIQEEK